MNKKKSGRRKESVQKKVDWKAREIVHPDAVGIDGVLTVLACRIRFHFDKRVKLPPVSAATDVPVGIARRSWRRTAVVETQPQQPTSSPRSIHRQPRFVASPS
jgi:hypothetical protein